MPCGWAKYDLEVDLSKGKIERQEIDPGLYEAYLGSKGTNAKILWDRVSPETDPFSPDNLLIFGAGVLAGTIVPGANRGTFTFKSPVNGFLAYSAIGGYFAPELKYAGYNSIVISGKSPSPVYLWIHNDTVELRDAGHLWGKDTQETQILIREETHEKAQVVCIGQAGENRVHFASIEHGLGVSASRRGGGAVMGDKKLKAIAVYGTKDLTIARPARLYELCEQILGRIGPWQKRWDANPGFEIDLHLPSGAYGHYRDTVSPETLQAIQNRREIGKAYETETPLVRRVSCHNCVLHCRRVYLCSDGRYCGMKCESYATPMITAQIFESGFANEFYNLCEKYGMDYFAPANLIPLAITLYEKGILTREDTDGMHLEFGNPDVFPKLMKKIACREGIGDILADGVYRAVRRIGRGAEKYDVSIKKLETRNEFRFYNIGHALGGAVYDHIDSDRARGLVISSETMPREERENYLKSDFWGHRSNMAEHFLKGCEPGGMDLETRVQTMSYSDEYWNIVDALGICAWWAGRFDMPPPITGPALFADLLSSATGMDMDEAGLTGIAKRMVNLVRSYNVREGLKRRDDTVPEFYFEKPPPAHFSRKTPNDSGRQTVMNQFGTIAQQTEIRQPLDRDLLNRHIERWYEVKGWDRDGIPTGETLTESGLEEVRQDLERRGLLKSDK
jgi:aldehyde:ferredoxin oxidoreductase